jgi:hypothetical protein
VRHALKRDSSHRSIAQALLAVGADVLEGFDCDLYVKFRERAWLIECKSRDLVEAKRTGGYRKGSIKPKQERLRAIFGEQFVIAFDAEQALTAIGAIQRLPESNEWEIAK